jgi:hypothetical protein
MLLAVSVLVLFNGVSGFILYRFYYCHLTGSLLLSILFNGDTIAGYPLYHRQTEEVTFDLDNRTGNDGSTPAGE